MARFKYPLSPYGGLVSYPLALLGGLQDSNARPDPTMFQKMQNFVTFRGRFALRAPVVAQDQFLDDQGSPAPVTNMLGCCYYPADVSKPLYALAYSSITQKVYLYAVNLDGTSPTRKGVVWSGLSAKPRPVMAVLDGGSVTAQTSRIYISDYTLVNAVKFWDGTAIQALSIDFAARGTDDPVFFAHVFTFMNHIWGTQYFNSLGSTRRELLRFSQPGLIPAVEPSVGSGLTGAGTGEEWWTADFRSVGRRNDPITAVTSATSYSVIHKLKESYALFGYDSQSWALKALSLRSGCAGPYASCTDGTGMAYWWSDRGPQMTDGNTVVDISESVRKHILQAQVSDEIIAQFSPDDGLVYFIYPNGTSATAPNHWLAWDTQRQLWSEGDTVFATGDSAGFFGATAIQSNVLPGPVGSGVGGSGGTPTPPTALTAIAFSDTEIDLTWGNSDTAIDTTTQILWGTSNPPTVVQATVASGISSYKATGLAAGQNTTYYFQVRHVRNQTNGALSTVASDKTALKSPDGLIASRETAGITLVLNNYFTGANIQIWRQQLSLTQSFGQPIVGAAQGFSLLTTLTGQTTGVVTFHDTANIKLGVLYQYYAVATAATDHNSQPSAYSNVDLAGTPINTDVIFLGNHITTAAILINWNVYSSGLCSQIVIAVYNVTGFTFLDTVFAQVRKDNVGIGSPIALHQASSLFGPPSSGLSYAAVLAYNQDLVNGVSHTFDVVVSVYDAGKTLISPTITSNAITTSVLPGTCAGGIS